MFEVGLDVCEIFELDHLQSLQKTSDSRILSELKENFHKRNC